MELIIGAYKIYPLDRFNWVIAERVKREDPDTGNITETWVQRQHYFSRPQYAAEYVYDQLMRKSHGKLDITSAGAADVARLCEETARIIIDAVNQLMPDDCQVNPGSAHAPITLADPDSFKKRRRRKTTAAQEDKQE